MEPDASALLAALMASMESLLRLPSPHARPVLALNGPVGAGKTSLGRKLQQLAASHGIALAVASIDDLYLPLSQRSKRLAGNPFGVGRVPPGSHDIPLLLEALGLWRQGGLLRLPRFDKSLHGGQGDRSGWSESHADALLLEGWLMGCAPLSCEDLSEAMKHSDALGIDGHGLTAEELEWLPRWNRELEAYGALWHACDGLWVLRPSHWCLPRRWRFQAEARQRRDGGGALDPVALNQLVRASLFSLPPLLYQSPLLEPAGWFTSWPWSEGKVSGETRVPPLLGAVELDGKRRSLRVWNQSSLSSEASAIG